jgi:hypothetical protein
MVALRSHASGRRLFSDKKITHDLGIAKHCVQYLRHARPGVRWGRPSLSKRPELIARVADYTWSSGFEALTLGKLRRHLADHEWPLTAAEPRHPRHRGPEAPWPQLPRVLKTVNFWFLPTAFDQKRLWVTRLLVMFLQIRTLLVCVDESSF